jgi:hypothetical protein
MITFESLLPEILSYFSNAELASNDLRRRSLSLCGRQVRIVYSSEILETSLFKAFEHLENIENNAAPAFQIFVCDRNVLSRDLPGWAQLTGFSGRNKEYLMYNAGAIHALFNPDSQVFSLVDTASGQGWYYLPQVADLPWYEKSSPMRMLLHWCCEMVGLILVHAAAVGWASGAVLLVGRSGTGKSTTAMLATQSGFSFLGDDYVVLDNTRGPAVLSAYNSIKFRREMLERLPSAEKLSVNDPYIDEKGYFFLYETHPDSLVKIMSLKAVLLRLLSDGTKRLLFPSPRTRDCSV